MNSVNELVEHAKSLLPRCISPQGYFYASGDTGGNFKCLFGRDALKTSLLLMEYSRVTEDLTYLSYIRTTLYKLADTQGRRHNFESAEKPGWIIHELRTEGHEYLTRDNNWPVDEDGVMRIYQTADATALYLIAVYRYWQMTQDDVFLDDILYSVRSAAWAMVRYGDSNRDGLLDYFVDPARTKRGLDVWSWMDSTESIGEKIVYPVAPLEVQGYAYLAARLWAPIFTNIAPPLGEALERMSKRLRSLVAAKFAKRDNTSLYLASFIDGEGKTDDSIRSNTGHLLWASLTPEQDGVQEPECVLSPEIVCRVVERLTQLDMLDPEAGLRTLSSDSPRYDPRQYHNGAIWPVDNALASLGFRHMGYPEEAEKVAKAMFTGLMHFGKPGMELYWHHLDEYGEFLREGAAPGNHIQTWSLAAVLALGAY